MTTGSKTEVHVVAVLKARPGKSAALLEALEAIIPAVRREDGCIRYELTVDRADADRAVMLEVWRDEAALGRHETAAPFVSLAARFDELLAEPVALLKLQHRM
ncbi:putative quinol monooxygenase [Martelella sp. FOR1707]